MRIHHVQVPCPPGREEEAHRFYVDGLGFVEIPKPAELTTGGGRGSGTRTGRRSTSASRSP